MCVCVCVGVCVTLANNMELSQLEHVHLNFFLFNLTVNKLMTDKMLTISFLITQHSGFINIPKKNS